MDFEEYGREGRAEYAALATTVAAILTAAIGAEAGYRLQQVKARAKEPASLRRKLEQRSIAVTAMLEDHIKDLAGCRVIFYTNGDVTRFINSGIINQNFEVLEAKVHYPRRVVEDAAELYISNHYVVRFRPERIALPEYARFADMRCEIQIQTILNHAWAGKALEKAEEGGIQFTVIDTPPRSEQAAMAAAKCADLVVVPCRPQAYDLETIPNTLDVIRLSGDKPVFAVLNAVPWQGSRHEQAIEVLQRLNMLVCPMMLGQRAAFGDAGAIGQSPLEYDPRSKASQEIMEVYKYTFNALSNLPAVRGAHVEESELGQRVG